MVILVLKLHANVEVHKKLMQQATQTSKMKNGTYRFNDNIIFDTFSKLPSISNRSWKARQYEQLRENIE